MRTNVVRTHLIGFIWLAAAIDVWCCQFLTVEAELNPMAAYTMARWDVWTLVALKVVGTWIATEWLRYLPLYFSVAVAVGMVGVLLILGGAIPV